MILSITDNCFNLFSWMNPQFDIIVLVDTTVLPKAWMNQFKEDAQAAYDMWFSPGDEATAYCEEPIGDWIRRYLEERYNPHCFTLYFKETKEVE